MTIPAFIKGGVILVATFVAGLAAGVVVERSGGSRHAGISLDAHDPMHRLTADLSLDADQQRAIAAILANHQKDVDAAWHAVQPHARSTMDSACQAIEKILRPDQLERFRKMISARHPNDH